MSEGGESFYTISAAGSELWWLFNERLATFTPFISIADTPTTNFIGLVDVRVDGSGGESSGWVGVRGAPSFVGTELDQLRVVLTTGPGGNMVSVEQSGTVGQQVFYSGLWPEFDAVGDGWHAVMVVAQGDRVAFFVNGTFLTTVEVSDEDRLLGPLSIGVLPGGTASFDNVEIWDLRGVGAPDRSYR